jgi:hypothetical protein
VNRGRNGDRVGDMLFRLPAEVIPEHPDVVIWQLGTNALLTDLDRKDFGSLFSRGVRGHHRHGSRLDRHGSAIRTQGPSASTGGGFRPPNRRCCPSGRCGTFPSIRTYAVLARQPSRLRTILVAGSIAHERLELSLSRRCSCIRDCSFASSETTPMNLRAGVPLTLSFSSTCAGGGSRGLSGGAGRNQSEWPPSLVASLHNPILKGLWGSGPRAMGIKGPAYKGGAS